MRNNSQFSVSLISRFNISFEDGGESVQFRQNVYYVSRPSLSVTNANDAQVTAFNLVTQGLFAKLKGTVYMPLLPHLLTGSDFDKFFVVKSVSEMLFGYPDSVLNTLHSFVPDLCPYTRYPGLMINQTMEEALASQLPNKVHNLTQSDPNVRQLHYATHPSHRLPHEPYLPRRKRHRRQSRLLVAKLAW